MKRGTKVKTWISPEIGQVIGYNKHTRTVTVVYPGSKVHTELPETMCTTV